MKGGMHEDWQPGDDICIVVDDKTGAERSPEQIDSLFEDIRTAANKHGFDLTQWGSRAALAKYFHRFYNADGSFRE